MRKYITHMHSSGTTTISFEENGYVYCFTDEDPSNSDYQQYLAWVAEGNTAEEWSPNATI